MGTDNDWETWGRIDPYFGVLSDEAYRTDNLSEDNRQAFFASGESHTLKLLETIQVRFGITPAWESALDFGCGVGRVLIPLARRCTRATGVDISPSMLAEARRNCDRLQLHNVDLVGSDDGLRGVQGSYDLIHSHIVFAHIDPRRGYAIMEALAGKVRPGGFIAVQVLYLCTKPRWVRALVKLRYRLPPLNALRNLLRRRPLREPPMQLHVYDLSTLLRMLRRVGFNEVLMTPDAFDNDEWCSVVLLAQRSSRA